MPRQPVRPLILSLAVAMAPLVVQLPGWAVGWCLLSWGYLLAGERRAWPLPSSGLLAAIFIAGTAMVLLSAGLRVEGGDFIALLAVMAGIKPLEVRNRRDSMVTVFLAYFLVITSLFVFENLSMTLYLFVSVWEITGVMINVNDPGEALSRQLRLAGRLILKALPLMVLLFFLFPRLSDSFLKAPWARTGRSGFSDRLRIGDVSRLVLSDAPAFAVFFDGAVPNAARLYWRGIVFEQFDGTTWYPARSRPIQGNGRGGKALCRYTVDLQPHDRRNLFALDLPMTVGSGATIMADHTVVSQRPVRRRFQYRAASLLDYRKDPADPPDADCLQLPAHRNPRAIALGEAWARQSASPAAVVARALTFFRKQGFTYTLRPGHLGADAVDDFLFTRRKGFCEHFASAFAVLMRAAGVPARLVGGYQGGEWNALGGFLSVRQSDAHVWCEVWLEGKGWVRVDPTFVVAPDRIRDGIEGTFSGPDLPWFLRADRSDPWARWIDAVRLTWEAVNTRWDVWIMGFSAEDQSALLERLGVSLGRYGRWLIFMALPALFLAMPILWRLKGRLGPVRQPADEARRIYDRFLGKMARIGPAKAPHQGPMDYARAVAERYPAMAPEVVAIAAGYIALRYADTGGRDALKAFRRRVRRFRVIADR